MKNVKAEVAAYREAVRHLWNSTFSTLDESLRFGTGLELFEQVDNLIFRALVCEPLGLELGPRASFDPIMDLKVTPTSILTEAHLMINRSLPASGYWDDPVKILKASDVDLAFIGFFDWDGYSVKDCAYLRVRIVDCKSHSNLVGRDALMEAHQADVFFIRGH